MLVSPQGVGGETARGDVEGRAEEAEAEAAGPGAAPGAAGAAAAWWVQGVVTASGQVLECRHLVAGAAMMQ